MRSAIVSAIRIIALAAAALLLATFSASAQGWPSRPVMIIVPFPAGGTADLLTRGVAQALSDELGQQFVVDNRPGAGGTTGAAAVARAAPDGYTLLFASGSLAALNKFMFKNLPYDPTRDLAPVALVIKIPSPTSKAPVAPWTAALAPCSATVTCWCVDQQTAPVMPASRSPMTHSAPASKLTPTPTPTPLMPGSTPNECRPGKALHLCAQQQADRGSSRCVAAGGGSGTGHGRAGSRHGARFGV